ncbi:hypothetical protein CYMTET_5262 [Cymbomonas tetramitiformis]|uniref:Uncharacterized protein n=1 Tax=Cymbomonas tetramitiformis TaxID=36881 RepID=A0AAE0GZP5_9CHLO|nr:hypothetical protein CYMTET_5262 [Cymbomonas tetramitiformis]
MSGYMAEIEALEGVISRMRGTDRKNMGPRKSTIGGKSEDSDVTISKLKGEISALSKLLQDAKAKINEQETQLSHITAVKENMAAEVNMYQMMIAEAEKGIKALQDQMENLMNQMGADDGGSAALLQQLRGEVKGLEKSKQQLQQETIAKSKEIRDMTQEVATAQADAKSWAEKNQQLRSKWSAEVEASPRSVHSQELQSRLLSRDGPLEMEGIQLEAEALQDSYQKQAKKLDEFREKVEKLETNLKRVTSDSAISLQHNTGCCGRAAMGNAPLVVAPGTRGVRGAHLIGPGPVVDKGELWLSAQAD